MLSLYRKKAVNKTGIYNTLGGASVPKMLITEKAACCTPLIFYCSDAGQFKFMLHKIYPNDPFHY